MEFSSSNFLVPHSPQDRNIQIRDVDGIIVYTISPCDVTRSYALNNLLKIQTLTTIISVNFTSSSEAISALTLFNDISNTIIGIFPCGVTVDPTYSSSSFLSPYSSTDTSIRIRNNDGDIVYTILPCEIRSVYTITSSLKIQMLNNSVSIAFDSSSEAISALSLLNIRIGLIISVFPCEETFSTSFSSVNFLSPYTSEDNSIQIRNTSGSVIYIIGHCDVSNTYVSTDTLKIQTTNGLISVVFSGFEDASSALLLLNIRIEELKLNFPCGVSGVEASTSTFTSDTFLLPYGDGEKKAQIRNTSGDVVFNIDPCNVVVTYIKDSGKIITVKSIGNPNLIHIEFASNSDASIALTSLQGRIDYIKTIYPCDGSAGFTYVQSVASDVWEINHKLNRRPSVFVMNSSYQEIEGLIVNIDNNNTNIYFNSDISGSAYLI